MMINRHGPGRARQLGGIGVRGHGVVMGARWDPLFFPSPPTLGKFKGVAVRSEGAYRTFPRLIMDAGACPWRPAAPHHPQSLRGPAIQSFPLDHDRTGPWRSAAR
jgi:hypothetical protein